MSLAHILVVDDEKGIRDTVQDVLEDEGFEVTTAGDAALAHAAIMASDFDLILMDIWMPDVDGITLLKEVKQQGETCPVVMISGHGSVETAVEAIQYGAYDFLEKPLSTAKLLVTINRALQSGAQSKQIKQLKNQFEAVTSLVGETDAIKQLRIQIEKIANTQSWVMINGPAGSGKGVVARSLHQHSVRKDQPFVEVSLAAIPAQNIARRLFGSEDAGQKGCFEQAKGGTLYLDEIGDLDADTQAKLLSALQAGRFMRVGGQTPIEMDVRIISSTTYPLESLVNERGFREDLFYRLNVVPIKVPPLRSYPDDISALASFYIQRFVDNEKLPYRALNTAAVNRLRQHTWPGNVRELMNSVQQLLIVGGDAEIDADEIESILHAPKNKLTQDGSSSESSLAPILNDDLRTARDVFEKTYFEHHLKTLNGNVTELSKVSGLERTNLYRKLKALGINPKDWK
ncbi:MAG: sigma-54 dependent transcriptional regulator [Arenicellales bacterium]